MPVYGGLTRVPRQIARPGEAARGLGAGRLHNFGTFETWLLLPSAVTNTEHACSKISKNICFRANIPRRIFAKRSPSEGREGPDGGSPGNHKKHTTKEQHNPQSRGVKTRQTGPLHPPAPRAAPPANPSSSSSCSRADATFTVCT